MDAVDYTTRSTMSVLSAACHGDEPTALPAAAPAGLSPADAAAGADAEASSDPTGYPIDSHGDEPAGHPSEGHLPPRPLDGAGNVMEDVVQRWVIPERLLRGTLGFVDT